VIPTIRPQTVAALPERVQPIEDHIALPTAPLYSDIARFVAPGRLILGYNVSGAIYGDITDLLSTAIVGRPGTGKSTWLRCILAQVLRIGGQACIFDPHGSIADEIGDLLQCAESASEIERSAARLEQELDRRLIARRQGQTEHTPLLLLADEWPIVQAVSEQAVQTARRVILEGRKVSMFGLISGQGLPASLLGGTLVRDALASRYVFNTTAQQARMAGLDNDTAKVLLAQLETSGPGLSILATARRKPEIVAIPETVISDITAESGRKQLDMALPAFSEIDTDETEAVKLPVSESEKQQIISLARAGVARRDMTKALRWSASRYSIIKQVLDQEGL
jgi:hypothetical protein